ncbi:DUF1275 domain-containing protein, partial [Salmonella enterica subsp. enterica serovar Typhimurium]|nr:DUF1275 domain-containing protein [Salmonella enterica subsp. enterica serovar Typhimurium]
GALLEQQLGLAAMAASAALAALLALLALVIPRPWQMDYMVR